MIQNPPCRLTFRKHGRLITELDCYALPATGDAVTINFGDYKVDHRHSTT
jgi:hypothetical protein